MAVGSQLAIANVLVDLNVAVQYRITIHIYASKKFWRINYNLRLLMQTTKFNSPPNFPAIWYTMKNKRSNDSITFRGQ